MATKLITCPESGHLEQIEFDADPLGVIITSCTRFCPRDRVRCPGTCARRMDQRAATARRNTGEVLILTDEDTDE